MKLSTKHGEQQQTVIRADFTGGLNTSMAVEDVAENQLARVLNMEVDHTNGKLRTVSGTRDILSTPDIFAAIYDLINGVMLIVKDDRQIYLADFDGNIGANSLGRLSGELYPKYFPWGDGCLIASGGKLQYFNGANLLLIDSPQADDVFVRAGRVVVTFGSTIRYSGVGDENFWADDSNVESASKFVEAGYKDGSNFVGVAQLSNNLLVIKANKICYRLVEEYPRWSVGQVATNVECSGRRSYCAVGDDVFILGADEAHLIQNAYYGNVKPEDIATFVKSEIHRLPKNAQVRYVAPLAQVWCIGRDGFVLIYDALLKSWFERKFNAEILDVFTVGDEVYPVKRYEISGRDNICFVETSRVTPAVPPLLKRPPLNADYYSGEICCGRVTLPLPIPDTALKIFGNKSPIYRNRTKLCREARRKSTILPQPPDEKIFWSEQTLPDNRHKIFAPSTFVVESRNVFRSKYLDVSGHGHGGGFIMHSIVMDIAEV